MRLFDPEPERRVSEPKVRYVAGFMAEALWPGEKHTAAQKDAAIEVAREAFERLASRV